MQVKCLTLNDMPPTNILLGIMVPNLGALGALGIGEEAVELLLPSAGCIGKKKKENEKQM